jgi:hypothetical protein
LEESSHRRITQRTLEQSLPLQGQSHPP